MYNWKFNIELNHVKLSNFRGVEALNIKFDKKLTVLIGENGSGKTTVLDALASLLQVFVDKITSNETGKIEASYISMDDIRNGTVEATNELSTIFSFEGLTVKKYPNGEEPEEGEEIEFEDNGYDGLLEWYLTLNESGYEGDDATDATDFIRLSEIIRSLNLNYKSNLREREKSKHIPLSVPLVVYYPCSIANTNTLSTNERLRTDIMTAYDNALTYSSFDFSKFFRWFKWQENIKIQLGENAVLDAVSDAIYQMLNDKEAVFSNLKTDWLNNPDGELLITKGDEKNPLKISQFSSGEKSILALTADLARRLATANPYAENPLHGNGIVLIDEIDIHLHPRWQRVILPKLMRIFPNIQWVVTTHSALVISDYTIQPEQVLILTEEENTRKKIIVSLAELKLNNSGVEPNKIYEDIMLIPLRDEKAKEEMDKLSKLLNPLDFEKEETQILINELTKKFGTEDPFIRKINHHLRLLNRRKVVA